jgi:hypothetical protein
MWLCTHSLVHRATFIPGRECGRRNGRCRRDQKGTRGGPLRQRLREADPNGSARPTRVLTGDSHGRAGPAEATH